MKTDPSVTYNHMEDDEQASRSMSHHKESYPISLYMILLVDAILVSAIIFITFKLIF